MSKWIFKALAKGAASHLPFGESLDHMIRQHVTKTADFHPTDLVRLLEHGQKHLRSYLEYAKGPTKDFCVFELGTGFVPLIPIAFYLCGAGRVVTVDKVPLLNLTATKTALTLLFEYADDGRLANYLPDLDAERLSTLRKLEQEDASSCGELLSRIGIEVIVGDARDTVLPDASVDFIFSNGVFQDIARPIVDQIFQEFSRILRVGGVMSHRIVIGDRFVFYDPSISIYNFLKYSDSTWRLFNSSLHYQNRLTVADYRHIHASVGFRIAFEDNEYGPRAELESIRLAEKFRSYSMDDLAVVMSWIVSLPGSPQKAGAESS